MNVVVRRLGFELSLGNLSPIPSLRLGKEMIMNDYDAILNYISTKVPAGAVGGGAGPGQPTFIRDLQQYYNEKKMAASTATKLANVKLMKHDFFNQFGLNYSGAGPS